MEPLEENLVVCPRCNGTTKSPDLPNTTCGCCGGAGKITNQKYKAIMTIRYDLSTRLMK